MEKGRLLLLRTGIFAAAAVIAFFGISVSAVMNTGNASESGRADVVVIDTAKQFGHLERPPVVFLHDKHTDALEKKGKDCSTCHLSTDGKMSLKFKRTEDASKTAIMDIYHENCIECHREAHPGEPTGPASCGECHKEKPDVVSARIEMGLDHSLHFRHVKAREKKCEDCHHAYDAAAKKLVYKKGEEGTCRYCHKAQTEENRVSMSIASHTQCIACHRETLAAKKTAGPVKCAGCHGEDERLAIAKLDEIPRMERNQPDITLVRTKLTAGERTPQMRMPPVPFDHKAHEKYNDTCRVCHHADLKTCGTCHTLTGAKEGNWVKLSQAMHMKNTDQSCIGCHTDRQTDKNCAGCHGSIQKTGKEEKTCKQCHEKPISEDLAQLSGDALKKAEGLFAGVQLENRKLHRATYPQDAIPEKVLIKELSNKYEPVDFPHRKIVNTLVKNIEKNNLAAYFHMETGTVCQGCHHNSPATDKPPRCGNCHGKPFDENAPGRPGISGAYHQQCLKCHEYMKIEKPSECIDCHKEKNRS